MTRRCPELGLVDNRNQVYSVSTHRHRCYLRGQPERIATRYQAEVCLVTGYGRCPRRGETVARAGMVAGLQAAPVRKLKTSGRPWTVTEFMVLGLGLAILLAVGFTGYAVLYRLQVGPGMAATSRVADAGWVATGTVTLSPTLVPTFTPIPPPSPTVVSRATEPSTPAPEPVLPTPTSALRPPADSPPTRLVIPKISVDIPVMPVGVKAVKGRSGTKVIWADLPNVGGFHQSSAYPGNPGNTVINGHRDIQGSVFRDLDQVKAGDQILLYVGARPYVYDVTETLVVPETFASAEQRENNLRLIGDMPDERLTLITCTPVGLATHRLLVIARPPGQIAPQMPEAGQGSEP